MARNYAYREESKVVDVWKDASSPSFQDNSVEILILIDKTKDENWDIRKTSFDEIQNYIGNRATNLPNFTLFEKIIQAHFEALNDKHHKVQMSVIDNLQWLLLSFGETLEPYIYEIVPRVIDNLSIKND